MMMFTTPQRYDQAWLTMLSTEIASELESCLKKGARFCVGGLSNTEIVVLSVGGRKFKLSVDDEGTLFTTEV